MKEFIIDENYENQRIDKYCKKLLSRASPSLIYKMIRKKDIKVNGKKVDNNYLLKKGDVVSMFLYEDRFQALSAPLSIYDLPIEFEVVYEDDLILIVNKPQGLLVHEDAQGTLKTLSNEVLTYLYNKGEYDSDKERGFTPGPVHRLDRNTSGLVIFGKTMRALQDLNEMMKKRHCIDKTYLTITKGYVESGEYIDYVIKDEEKSKMVVVSKETENALKMDTIVERIDYKNEMSLVKVKLITGRTHQIRVHLAHLGYPVIGDRKYGDFEFNKSIRNKYHLNYQFLHAYSLTFIEPIGCMKYLKNQSFKAPLPKNLQEIKDAIFTV